MEWMKRRIKLMIWNIRRKNNIQSEQLEGKRIPKKEDRVRSLWDNFKHTNIQIIGVPEGEEKN